MTAGQTLKLQRELDHLRARCAALQGEVWDLNSQLARARAMVEHAMADRPDSKAASAAASRPATPAQDTL